VEEGVEDDVLVVVCFDVVEADVAGKVRGGGEVVGWGGRKVVEGGNLGGGEAGVEDGDDVGEGGVFDFVAVWEDVELDG
jgi:hypothetical protein